MIRLFKKHIVKVDKIGDDIVYIRIDDFFIKVNTKTKEIEKHIEPKSI